MKLTDINFLALAIGLAFTFTGALAHFFKKWLRKETTDNLFSYLFKSNVKHTINALVVATSGVFVSIANGSINPMVVEGAVTLFMAGYMADSMLNKSNPYPVTLK